MSIEIISFIASSVATFIFKMYANSQADKQAQFEMMMASKKQKEEVTQSAREFQPQSYVRRFIAVSVVAVFLYLVAHTGYVTIVEKIELPTYLFGLFGGGESLEVRQVLAPILTHDFTSLVYIIIGFYFGSNLGNRK